MPCAIEVSLARGGGPTRGAAPLEREVVEVGGVSGGALDRREDRLGDLGVELVSLDDVEAEEEGKDLPIDDVEIEGDDLDEDETFLAEEEEGDDDVADLIDGDLEDDEEV